MISMASYNGTQLTQKQITTMPTPRLLTYYKKYTWIRGMYICSCCQTFAHDDSEGTQAAKNKENNRYMDSIRDELNKREHVE